MPIYIDNNVSWRMFMSQWQIEALLTIAETFWCRLTSYKKIRLSCSNTSLFFFSSQFPYSTPPASISSSFGSMSLPGLTVPLLLLLHPLLLTSSHAPSLSSWRCNQTASRSATKIQVHSHKVKQQGGPREETEKVVEQDEWNIDSVRRTKMWRKSILAEKLFWQLWPAMVVVDSEWAEMFQILFAHFFSLEYSVSRLCGFVCGISKKTGSTIKGDQDQNIQ